MRITGGQLARRLKRRAVDWSDRITDPRFSRGRRHKHQGLLNLLVLGFASGLTTLRRIEELSEVLSRPARRVMGLSKAVSDTTLYMLLAMQDVAGLRETLVAQVRALLRSKRVTKDLFPLGVIAFDGKSVWTSSWKSLDGAKEMLSKEGVIYSSLAMLNAVLVSSSVRPCVDIQLIREKSGESPCFREMVRRVSDGFHAYFDVITGDAGLLCRENAALIRGLNKHFVFTVKGNQQRLFTLATEMFEGSGSPARITTKERRSGALMTRTLHTQTVSDVQDVGFYEAQELWRVEQRSVSSSGKETCEVRFFISSLPPRTLSPSQKLQLVRLHWGIENGRHWAMDAIFEEDDHQPCQLSRRAVEVGCWLRALAYNLAATLRAASPLKDKRLQPWRRVVQNFRDALVFSTEEVLTAHLA